MHAGTLMRGRPAFWLLIALTAATRLALAFADHRSLIANDIYPDDAFYYLRIAANLVDGRGFTFDGAAPTNGFHPLYLFCLMPIVALARANLVLPIHLSAVLLTCWAVGTAVILHAMLLKWAGRGVALFGLLVWAVCPYFVLMSVNGLETGLAITFGVLVPWLYISWFCVDEPPRAARALTFGVVCGLAILARLDLALLIGALAVDWLARHARRPRPWIRSAGLALVAAAVVWVPWALVSHAATGYWLPLSGPASRQIALNFGWLNLQPIWTDLALHPDGPLFDPRHVPAAYHLDVGTKLGFVFLFESPLLAPLRANVPAGAWAELDHFVPYRLFLTSPRLWTSLAFAAVAALGFFMRRRARAMPVAPRRAEHVALRRIVAIYLVGICLGYTFYSPTHWYFNRYLAGPILLTTVYVLIEVGNRLSRRLALTVGTAAFVIVACQLAEWRFVRTLRWSDAPPAGFLATWQAFAPRIAPDERVAAFQAGTYGYFAGRDVINLDGKVNQDAFTALKDQRLHEYISAQHIRYIIDGKRMLAALSERYAPPGSLPIRSIAVDPSGVHLFRVGDQ